MKVVIDIPPQTWALVREGQIPVRAYECIVKGTPQTRWIPIKYELPCVYDCPLPDDGQDVLITTCNGNVVVDTFCREYGDGCYFETYCDDGDVVAWMPLPEPYKAESEENNGTL